MGLVFMLVVGPAVGNYVCSVVYRLPLGRTPFERHPYCGQCNADLKPKDLVPILSWLSTRGRCRYCRAPIPGIYTVIELACLVLFVLNFLAFGMGEQFLLLTAFGVFVITLAAIEWQQGWLSASIYSYAFAFAALSRTLAEATIYGWVRAFVVMLVIGLVIGRIEAAIKRRPFTPFAATWIWWLALMVVPLPAPLSLVWWLAALALPLGFVRTRLAIPVLAALALLLPLFSAW